MIRSSLEGMEPGAVRGTRASQHKSPESLAQAEELGIEVRLLPAGPLPELKRPMDHLWRARQEAGRSGDPNRPSRSQTPAFWPFCRLL